MRTKQQLVLSVEGRKSNEERIRFKFVFGARYFATGFDNTGLFAAVITDKQILRVSLRFRPFPPSPPVRFRFHPF